MTAEEWIRNFAKELGLPPPVESESAKLLDLAAIAAHSSERIAAPLACWLAGASGRSLDESIEIANEVEGDRG